MSDELNPLLYVQAVASQPDDEDPRTALFLEGGGPMTGERVLEVFAHRSQIDEGVLLVQLDTNLDTGPLRIQLNDGPVIWEGDPAVEGNQVARRYWCAECGTGEADTYVVTTLDYDDPVATSTEVCLRCHREIAAQEELVEVLEAIAYCEADYDEQEEEDPASRLKQAVVDYLSKLGLPTHPTDDDGAQVQLAGTDTL